MATARFVAKITAAYASAAWVFSLTKAEMRAAEAFRAIKEAEDLMPLLVAVLTLDSRLHPLPMSGEHAGNAFAITAQQKRKKAPAVQAPRSTNSAAPTLTFAHS